MSVGAAMSTGAATGVGAAMSVGAAPLVLVAAWPAAPRPADVALLDEAERRRLGLFDRARDAAGFAAGRALLRLAAGRRLGLDPGVVPVAVRPGRRPTIPGSRLACSLAHGGDVVVAAVGDAGAIGVDVEPVDGSVPPDELADVARYVLGASAPEVEAIRSVPAARRAFFERWTLTEAVLKALGTGLAADPRRVRVAVDGPHGRLLAAPGIPAERVAGWQLGLLDLAPGHVAAIATDRPVGLPVVEPVT